MTEDLNIGLRLSLQRALLGQVTPNLRAVAAKWKENIILIRYIIDGEITEEMRDNCYCVGTVVISDFSSPCMIDELFERLDAPEPLEINMQEGWFWAYMRKEN